MKSCNTSVARAMGYLSRPSVEEQLFSRDNVTILGPASAEVRSYHSGLSSREEFMRGHKKGRKRRVVLFKH